eukprot:scaffold111725_cov57-Phaeocystis_antarctica.AAC.2
MAREAQQLLRGYEEVGCAAQRLAGQPASDGITVEHVHLNRSLDVRTGAHSFEDVHCLEGEGRGRGGG